MQANSSDKIDNPTQSCYFTWVPPRIGCVKLNIDGNRNNISGAIAAVGVVRNHDRQWIKGFVMNKGKGCILEAELWAVFEGLKMAWDGGFRKVQIDSDCLEAISLIQRGCNVNNPLWYLIQECRRLIDSPWCCELSHVYRESNFLADAMAAFGQSLSCCIPSFEEPPPFVFSVFAKDADGIAYARELVV
ncbi:hypothetical protein ACOSP7_004695 [Xanthoceras sorbifolium]